MTGLERKKALSGSDGCHQGSHADDLYHPLQVVGEDMQAHFRSHMLQGAHQEVSCTHPEFDGAEGMLHRLPSDAHHIGFAVQPLLHRFENFLVLPAADAAVVAWRALGLDGATWAVRTPVAVNEVVFLHPAEASDELAARRAAVGIGIGLIDKV